MGDRPLPPDVPEADLDLVPVMTRISSGLAESVRWLKVCASLLLVIALLLLARVLGVGA